MARKGEKTISFDILANTQQAEQAINSLSNSVSKIEKDGKIHLQADVDTSQLSTLQKLSEDRKIKISVDSNSIKDLNNMMQQLEGFPSLQKKIQTQIKNLDKQNKSVLSNQLDSLIGDKAQKQIDKLKKTISTNVLSPDYEKQGLAASAAKELKNLEIQYKAFGAEIGKINVGNKLFDMSQLEAFMKRQQIFSTNASDKALKNNKDYKEQIAQLNELYKFRNKIKQIAPEKAESLISMPTDDIQGWITQLRTYVNEVNELNKAKRQAKKDAAEVTASEKKSDSNQKKETDKKASTDVDVDYGEINKARALIDGLKSDLNAIKNQKITITLDVDPSVESIKSDLKSLDAEPINVKINLGKSLENIQKLATAFNSKGVHDSLHQLTTLGGGFSTAFANLKDAVKAPTTILDNLNAKAKELKKTLDSIGVTKFKDMDKVTSQMDKIKKENDKAADKTLNELVKMESDLVKREQNLASKEQALQTKTNTFDDSKLKKYEAEFKGYENISKTLTDIGGVREKFNDTVQSLQGAINNDDVENITRYRKELAELSKITITNKQGTLATSDAFKSFTEDLNKYNPRDISKAIENYYKEQGKAIESIKQSGTKGNDTWSVSYRDGDLLMRDTLRFQQFASATEGIDGYTTALRTATKVEKEYMTSGQKWMSGFKSKISNLTQYMTGADILYRAAQELKEGFSFVKDLNSLMTTIDQTSDITGEGLQELSQAAIDQAKNLGVAAEQVTGSIEVYAAYGETVDSLLSKAEPTTMLAKASGADVKTASDQIQGVLQQFTELEGQETRIVNTYEKIAANIKQDFGVGIQNIAEGTQVAGSVAEDAGKLMPECTVMCI